VSRSVWFSCLQTDPFGFDLRKRLVSLNTVVTSMAGRGRSAALVEIQVRCVSQQLSLDEVVYVLPVCSSETTSIVLANGKTRHQLDMTKSSGLIFDMLLSSELLGLAKPDPAMYLKAAKLFKCEPGECVMVSAHHDDLRTAKRVYVYRFLTHVQSVVL
jgi:hypothetical protein